MAWMHGISIRDDLRPVRGTVPVPYGAICPLVGSSVISTILMPGGVLIVFGKYTATGWLASALAGWNATMNTIIICGLGGLASGKRSTGT